MEPAGGVVHMQRGAVWWRVSSSRVRHMLARARAFNERRPDNSEEREKDRMLVNNHVHAYAPPYLVCGSVV